MRQRGIRLEETLELRNCTEPQASWEGRRSVQSSDGVEWVALHEWAGCWGSGAQVPRASPLAPTGGGVGESFFHNSTGIPVSFSSVADSRPSTVHLQLLWTSCSEVTLCCFILCTICMCFLTTAGCSSANLRETL